MSKNNTTSGNPFIARAIPPFASVSALIVAIAFAPILPIGTSTFAILGGISLLTVGDYIYSKASRTKLDRYFEESGMIKNGKLPEVVATKTTDSGVQYKISIPAGMSTDDFEKSKLAIEQYLGTSINISFTEKHMYIESIENKLNTFYKYEFIHTENPLEVCLGYGYKGQLLLDIESCPHIIIGSETGGGKTTVLRNIIVDLILKNKNNIELFLCDFQKVGLGIFKNSKSVENFCSTPLEFQKMLVDLKKEHDKRLDLFFRSGVDDIQHYNRKHNKKKLPYRVIIVDEFSELAREKTILNQLMVRAAEDRKVGQHYIISTQRPSTTVVSGDIRANFPVAIALKVKDVDNSRIILDTSGAEKLRGCGHAILKQNGKLTEFQTMQLESDQAISLVEHTFEEKEEVKVSHVNVKRPPCAPIY